MALSPSKADTKPPHAWVKRWYRGHTASRLAGATRATAVCRGKGWRRSVASVMTPKTPLLPMNRCCSASAALSFAKPRPSVST